MVPDDPDKLLTRKATAAALIQKGYPVAAGTLATKAVRGGGPPYRRFGPRVLYRWGDALQWAQSRLSVPMRSTSEADAASAPLPSPQRSAAPIAPARGGAAFAELPKVGRQE
jgi:hypothetical protein